MKRHLSFVATLGMCFFALNATANAQPVKGDTGAVAIGRDVIQSTIIIGIPPNKVDELVREARRPLEELTTQQRENIPLLKEKLDLNERQVRAALAILGENDIPPDRLAAKLVEIAERFKELQTTASAQLGDDPKIAALRTDAQKAIEAGELTKADALLADVETEQRRALDRLAVNAAETSARRGEIALTRLRYAEAAKHFANAAAVFSPNSPQEDKRKGYLIREGRAIFLQGSEFGDNVALRTSIERFKTLVEMIPRETAFRDWVNMHNDLGRALEELGERESETAKLEEAVFVYREVLKSATRDCLPLQWASTQRDLGFALFRLGEREAGTTKLQEAAFAYKEALNVWTRERAPFEWATTHSYLGSTLLRLGERESGTTKLQEAIVAYREALKERTRERVPLEWASTQDNLGIALTTLGGREGKTTKLEEAIIAHREVLKERTRERLPLGWATTQNNLGIALFSLGERKSGTAKLEEAVAAYHEALKEWTRERVPLQWATTQNNLGNALYVLGTRVSGTTKLEEAVVAYHEAQKEATRERVPLQWAKSLGNEGLALMLLAERRRDAAQAERALRQINKAFETMRDGGNAQLAATFERQLPKARDLVARLGKGSSAR
jgi:tetratricopeptide (TPR) repeat protein